MERHKETKKLGGEHVRGTPKKKKSRLNRRQKLLVTLAIILAVMLGVVVACQSLFVRPELPDSKDETTEKLDYGEGVRPKAGGERKSKDYYTVLIMGRDTGGGGNTDTMLLASYDVTNQKATVMSIPRDTMVNIKADIKRINSVYNRNGGGEKGINAVYQEIAQLVGFEPDYQVIVEWEAVGEIVDAIGGVYFDVPRNMNYDDPYQDLSIHINKGHQLLSGKDAMGVIRYRHDNNMKYGYPDGDLGRIKTQQAFLKATVEQLLQVKNVTKINQFAKVFQKNVETDLSFNELLWFGQQAVMGGLKVENVNFVTMPNTPVSCWSRSVKNMQSYVVPNAQELLDLVNNDLSPFVEPSTLSDLDIMSVNADGSVSSTTGHVEDASAAKPPVKPSKPVETPSTDPVVDEDGNLIDPETGEIIGTETPPEETDTTPPDTGTTPPADGEKPDDGGATTPTNPTDPTAPTNPTTPTNPTSPETPAGGGTATPTEPAEPETPTEPDFAIIEQPPAA